MIGPSTPARACSLLAAVLIALPGVAGSRLHLHDGTSIVVERWHVEGDTLFHDGPAGPSEIARTEVLRIERLPEADEPPGQPDPPAPTAATTIRVPLELAGRLTAARDALEARDFVTAADLFGDLLRDAPDELQAVRVGYVVAQLALGEDATALGVVLDGLAREPRHPELLELYGDLRDRQERVEDALIAWREAAAIRPAPRLEGKIDKAERELAAGRDLAFTDSSNFTLRFDGDVDRALSHAVIDHLETEYWRLARELDHAPFQPITVLLYPEQEFREVTGSPDWVGGVYDGKIRVPLGGLRRLDAPARRVLTHELAHAVLHSKTRGNCPRWLHEGLAQRAESRRLAPADEAAVRAALSSGDPAAWAERAFSYPAALSLTRFVVDEWGETALLRMLDRLGDGAPLDRALLDSYGETYASLCRRWAAALVRGGAR